MILQEPGYVCVRCGDRRKYGVEKPRDGYKPLLLCKTCGKATRHEYSGAK